MNALLAMWGDSSHSAGGWREEDEKQGYRNKMQWCVQPLEATEISNSSVVYFKTQDHSHLFNRFLVCFRF